MIRGESQGCGAAGDASLNRVHERRTPALLGGQIQQLTGATMSGERILGGVAIVDVECEGRVTHSAGYEIAARVRTLVERGQAKILLNLNQVAYLDSAGLGAIIEAYTSTARRGGALKLLGLRPRVHHLFELAGLLSIIESFEDEGAAVRSFDSLIAVV
jgi:anti-sigma B factor antagonist